MRSVEVAERHFAPALQVNGWETDEGTQTQFAVLMDCLRKTDMCILPDFSDAVDTQGRITFGLEGSLGFGLHISESLADKWKNEGRGLPDRVSFEPQALPRLGREDSRRKVFFGLIRNQWFNGPCHEQIHQVAVKPFPGVALERIATHEMAMYQHIGKIGLNSITVTGALVAPTGKGNRSIFTISKFNPGLTTMDNINWGELTTSEAWDRVGKFAVGTLVQLHERLLFHGDTYFRNMGFNDNSEIVIVDAEQTVSAKRYEHPSTPQKLLQQRLSADFTELTSSINSTILAGQGLSDVEKFEQHNRHVFLPYREQLLHRGSENAGLLVPVLDKVVDQKYAMANGSWTPEH